MNEQKISVIQPNPITTARYEFSLLEKRIMYFIILELQRCYDMGKELQETLFQDLYVSFPMKKLQDKVSANGNEIRKAAQNMIGKQFDIDKPDGGWLIVGLVNYAEYDSPTGKLTFEISKKLLPYLFDMAKGFTAYYVSVAICLKSVYSQRFYEFCSQWKDTGKWHISVQQLREMLCLNEAYTKYSNFKRIVLETARKELKENFNSGFSDVWFDYKEKKKGRKVEDLQFTIYWKEKTLKKSKRPQTAEDLQYVHNILSSIFSHEKQKAMLEKALDLLTKRKLLSVFAKRLVDLEQQALEDKQPLPSYVPLVRYILKNDFKIQL